MVEPNPEAFNKQAKELLEYLKAKSGGDKGVIAADNALGVGMTYNYRLPCNEYRHSVTPDIIDGLRRGDKAFFFQDGVLSHLPFMSKSNYKDWAFSLPERAQTRIFDSFVKLTEYAGYDMSPEAANTENQVAGGKGMDDHNPFDYKGPTQEMIDQFNASYKEFLDDMIQAFPTDIEMSRKLKQTFQLIVQQKPAAIMEKFKKVIVPNMKLLIGGTQQVFLDHSALISKLPFMEYLPFDQYWKAQVIDNAHNRSILWKALQDMVLQVSGMGSIGGGEINALTAQAMDIANRIDFEGVEDPTTLIAKEAMATLMSNPDGLSGLMESVTASMQNFDPAIMQGVMDSMDLSQLEPILTACQGMMDGSTGAPAFGEACLKPGWLNLDNEEEGKTE